MSKLDELINELYPNGVEYAFLKDCCNILDNKRQPVTKSARQLGVYPYYGANGIQDYVSDYIFDGTYILVGEDGSVLTKEGTPIVNWAEGKIWVNNHAHIAEEIDGVMLRYLFHYIQTVNISKLIHGNIPKLTGKDFKAIQIPLPPLPIQEEIVRILDNFTELTAELTARKKQYEYYRDSLFEFGDEVEWKKLKDTVGIARGKRVVKSQLNYEKGYPVYQNSMSPLGYHSEFNCYRDTTFIICAGSAGSIGFMNEDFWAADDCTYFICNENIKSKFLFYALQCQQEYILSRVRKASVPRLGKDIVENISVPLPPLAEQQRIVDILDRFDTLCNDISSGLPAEIKMRQQQYEYYRDKLLTFKKLEN